MPDVVCPEVLFWPNWLLPLVDVPWFELAVLESPDELIVPLLLVFGFACALPLVPTPDELMLPLAVAVLSVDRVVPLAGAPLFGLLAAVPAGDWVPSTD